MASTVEPSALRRVAEARESIFAAWPIPPLLCKRVKVPLADLLTNRLNRLRRDVMLHHAAGDSTAS